MFKRPDFRAPGCGVAQKQGFELSETDSQPSSRTYMRLVPIQEAWLARSHAYTNLVIFIYRPSATHLQCAYGNAAHYQSRGPNTCSRSMGFFLESCHGPNSHQPAHMAWCC